MNRPGILLWLGILLMNNIMSAAEDCSNGGLSITSIKTNDVAISWRKTCFNSATSYIVTMEVTGNGSCSDNKSVSCDVEEEGICTNSIQDMGSTCTTLVRPCREVNLSVSGGGNEYAILTKLAPLLNGADWKLEEKSSIDTSTETLNVIWGPPEDPSNPYVSCATDANVTVSCLGTASENIQELVPQDIQISNVAIEGEATFNLSICGPGPVTPTITYMISKVPTETKKSNNINYVPSGWIKCYDCDSKNNTKCNDPFSPQDEFKTEPIYKSCAKKDDGDKAKRYGLRVSGGDGECDTNSECYYCNTDLCNGAPTYTAPMMFISVGIFIVQRFI